MTTFPVRRMENILPSSATVYERTLASQVERLLQLDIPIDKLWNPWECPEALLPYLAWTVSVDIWQETWPVEKKRSVVAAAIEMSALKGTEEGIRRYVALVDAVLKEVVTPPQDFFAAGSPSKAEHDAYIRKLPQLKLYLGQKPGTRDGDGLYAGDGFADAGFARFDLGPGLYGRRAALLRNGITTDLKVWGVTTTFTEGSALDVERVSTPGYAGKALVADFSFAGAAYLDASPVDARLFTVELDRSYLHELNELWLSTLSPGLDPVNPRYERSSDIGEPDHGLLSDFSFADRDFATPDRAGQLMNDHLYLFDPGIAAPVTSWGGFADHSRIGMPAYTAEVMIEAKRFAGKFEGFADETFIGYGFAVPDDLQLVTASLQAVTIAKALHDKVLVTFETTRSITLDDGFSLDSSINLDLLQRVPAHL